MSRRWLYIPFIIAGVMLFAYYLLWRTGAAQMTKGVEAWVADQQEAGLEISHAAIKTDGFPFFLRVHIDDVNIAQPGVWGWRTKRLTMDALPYDLNKLIFSTRDEQTVWAEGYGEWRVSAGDFRTSIANDKKRDWVFAATIGELRAVRSADGETASLKTLVFDLAPDPADNDTLTLNLAATDLRARSSDRLLDLDSFQTILAVTQISTLTADTKGWRLAGGRVNIHALVAQIDDAQLSVSGALHLDQDNYPTGHLEAQTIAPGALPRALGKAGMMASADADTAAAALTLAAIAGGGKITAPLILKEGTVQIAGVKLADLPRID